MNIQELIQYCLDRDIKLAVKGEELKVDAAKGALTQETVALLRGNKQALIDWLKARTSSHKTPWMFKIEQRETPEHRRLSFSQRRLWFIDKLAGGSSHYNLVGGFKLNGALDRDALGKALETIIQRHTVLRTVFYEEDGDPFQRVRESFELPLTAADLSGQDDAATYAEVKRRLLEEKATPFNLAEDVLLRMQLLTLGPGRHAVLLNMHHIAADGWSMGILVREISALYTAFADHKPNPLPALKLQYADYANWQREFMKDDVLEEELTYWRKQLDGIPQVHGLPLDRPRPPVQTFKAGAHFHDIDGATLQKIHKFAKAQDATLFMVLQTAFAVFLGRWSNAVDTVMGVPVAGRVHSELEPLIGFFVNNLVLRTDLSGNVPFQQLLAQNKQTILDAFAHQNLPFEALIDALKPERHLAYNPVCQIKFVLQNQERAGLELPGLEIDPLEEGDPSIHFDLDLSGTEYPDKLRLVWRYNLELFESATIARMAGSFGCLIQGILEKPDRPIFNLPLLIPAEKTKILEDFQGETIAQDRVRLECHFARQASETPGAIAAIGRDISLTYAQLNEKANRLAHYLGDLGIGMGDRVGIYLERSPELLVAILGILKSGAAYVPLEIKNTKDRLKRMTDDANIELVLVHASLMGNLPVASIDVLMMDEALSDTAWLDAYGTGNPEGAFPVLDTAYVMYTSGSTGQPKGVTVSHHALMTYCQFGLRHYYGDHLAGSLIATSYGFDITVPSLFLPLLRGGAVDLSLPEDDLIGLAERLADEAAPNYLLRMTPNHAMGFLPAMTANSPGAHTFIIGGDRFTPELAKSLRERCPASQIYNHYGPTEATVGCAMFDVSGHLDELESAIPVGKPMENRKLYVLNRTMTPVQIGMVGELYIGGEGLADGYVNRPAMTAAAFVPNPFLSNGSRLYRTGDLVRWLEDGNLVFMGRQDGQVKIRGFRVELAEIEMLLTRAEPVKEAVVVVKKDPSGQFNLAGYVILKDGAPPAESVSTDLRQFLAKGLPGYMVPNQIAVLDQWPLTISGKIDRAALPEPNERPRSTFAVPEGETEWALAEIWKETLRLDDISATASFFDIGGHSLLATRVLSEVFKRFGKKITVRAMFEHKTIRAFAKYLETLVSEDYQSIPTVARDEDLELSFAQQRLWFIDQLESGSVQYNIPRAMRIEGPLDEFAFQMALDQIVARHEVLRTNFYTDAEGRDRLVIRPPKPVEVQTIDLRGETPEAQERKTAELIKEEAGRKFDLSQDLLLRCRLIQLGDEAFVILQTMHHIAADGWSIGVMAREFNAYYLAFAEGDISALPELTIQYVDYAQWQRSHLQGGVLDKLREYWVNQLKGLPQVHRLPLDHPRPRQQLFQAKRFATHLDRPSLDALHKIAKDHHVTLFMVLQSAFAVLLGRWSSEQDLAMGMPIAGRTQKEVEPLIGFFVNLLVLRTRLAGNPPFSEVLQQAKRTALDAYANQELPFDMLVQELHPERSLGYHPLFQVLFSFRNDEKAMLELHDVKVSMVENEAPFTRSDLEMAVSEYEDGLGLHWLFAENLFELPTIERMATSFTLVLQSIIESTETRILDLPLVTKKDRRQLEEWNATGAPKPEACSVHGMFEAQVARASDQVALIAGPEKLTYAELDAKANRLAHYLRAEGIGLEMPVGLSMVRSPEMIAGILAILKAGAVYVPLDPDYPAARLAYMVEDSGISAILTHSAAGKALPGEGLVAVDLGDAGFWASLDRFPATAPAVPFASGQHLAYLLYTSGSTGLPKGVAGTHAALMNRIHWINRTYPPKQGERHAQKTSINFIDSLTETLCPLLGGAELHILPGDAAKSAHALGEFVVEHGIQRLTLVPSLLRTMLAVDDGNALRGLEMLVCSGDVLEPGLMATALKALPGVTFLNLYGSSEVCGDVTCFVCKEPEKTIARVPIGLPVANTKTYVLDSLGQLVPPGVRGTLQIEGVQLARAYWNRPGLTAARFLPNPFSSEPGARMHATGDLVRHRYDGELMFLGRNDHQVKLRGFRLELGEVEACLQDQPQVQDAVVVLRGADEDSRQLVAYLVLDNASDKDGDAGVIEALKTALAANLPDYMVPAVFVQLEAMPLTPNGKADRLALPDPSEKDLVKETYAAPRTHIETVLCEIWQGLLQVERVGIDDNFFDLGGHSLLATRVVSGIAEKLERSVGIWTLFEHRTVRTFAAFLEKEALAAYETIPTVPRDGAMSLSFSQERLWFIDQLEGASPQYNMPLALRLKGVLNRGAMQMALDTIVARHEILRGTFCSDQEEGAMVIHPPEPVAIRVLDLEGTANDAVILELAQAEAKKPFDLRKDLMLRCTLIPLDAQDHVALFTLHHIAADGWSLRILVKEFVALYQAFLEDGPVPLAALSIQYADFAHWQKQALSGEKLEASLSYWSQKLEGIPRLHGLPLDYPRPPQQNFSGKIHYQVLDPDLTGKLNQLARDQDVTLFMVLESLFALLTGRMSNETDIVLGSPIAGRPHKELEPLIGFFVNTLVLRTDLSGEPTFAELLAQTKATALAAYDHQHLPFEMLVEKLQPGRSLSHTPLFQIMFVLQNNEETALNLPGLEISGVPMVPELARFDLDLMVNESDDGLHMTWQYASSLFSEPTIIRMADAFETLAKGVTANPQQKIDHLPMLNDGAAEAILAMSTGPRNEAWRALTVPEMLERQSLRTPDAPAIRAGEAHLSYRELHARANQLANHLVALGVAPGQLVGIFTEPSFDMLIAILAVMKTGAAYVPIEVRNTPARIARIIEEAGIGIALTQSGLPESLPQALSERIVLDDPGAVWRTCSEAAPTVAIEPNSLIYTIFTSGSTGRPKGVMSTHASIMDYCAYALENYYQAHLCGSLLITSYAVDLTTPALFVPLMQGGCVALPPGGEVLETLSHHLFQGGTGDYLLRMTPMHASGLLLLGEGQVSQARHVFVIGGESFPPTIARDLQAQFPKSQIYNHYGPTEAAVGCSIYNVSQNLASLGQSVPIGKPMENTTLYVLGKHRQIQAMGVVGELYIGGAGVSPGYLNQPEMTAEKFVDNPFQPGQKLFRTGDSVRWLPTGDLAFLGRLDNMVKLRGFRVDLTEIETFLLRQQEVHQAVVVAKGDGSQQRLAAYITTHDRQDEAMLADMLRRRLKVDLPDYMVPAAIVIVDEIPIGPNGKIDLQALPAPSFQSAQGHVAPETEAEIKLAGIWQDLLKLDSVSATAGFFELGGHSLLAAKMVNLIKKAFGVDLPIRKIFEDQDIRGIAGAIDEILVKQKNQQMLEEQTESVVMEW